MRERWANNEDTPLFWFNGGGEGLDVDEADELTRPELPWLPGVQGLAVEARPLDASAAATPLFKGGGGEHDNDVNTKAAVCSSIASVVQPPTRTSSSTSTVERS